MSENVEQSVSILEKFVCNGEKRTRMPTVSCIGSIGLVGDEDYAVTHNWDYAVDVDPTEMLCQVILA